MILKKYTLNAPIKIEKKSKSTAGHFPAVQTIEENGVIKALEIICRCGEKTRIQLDYHKS